MLEICQQIHLSLNIKKSIFATPMGIRLGHVICKDGIKVNMVNIKLILELKPLVNQKKINIFLVDTGYYRKFTRKYSDITPPLNELF
jgi:hypothetical protein